jgi:hypothetical protein
MNVLYFLSRIQKYIQINCMLQILTATPMISILDLHDLIYYRIQVKICSHVLLWNKPFTRK